MRGGFKSHRSEGGRGFSRGGRGGGRGFGRGRGHGFGRGGGGGGSFNRDEYARQRDDFHGREEYPEQPETREPAAPEEQGSGIGHEGRAEGDESQQHHHEDGRPQRPRYPFKANYNDHFETREIALRHVAPALQAIQEATKPNTPEDFVLYDPYYCEGAVKEKWAALGFENVVHECRDFYADAKSGTMPPHDVLVTNPPYSEDHIPRLMDILIGRRKPFAILVPDYIAKKGFYTEALGRMFTPSPLFQKPGILKPTNPVGTSMATLTRSVDFTGHPLLAGLAGVKPSGPTTYVPPKAPEPPKEKAEGDAGEEGSDASGSESEGEAKPGEEKQKRRRPRYAARRRARNEPLGLEPFYIMPKQRYDYDHPRGTGKAHSHFRSMWIVWGGPRHSQVLLATRAAHAPSIGTENEVAVYTGLIELEHKGLVEVSSRANPTRRAKRGF